jgi:hypothetical protein
MSALRRKSLEGLGYDVGCIKTRRDRNQGSLLYFAS